jgi:hypothetical protein
MHAVVGLLAFLPQVEAFQERSDGNEGPQKSKGLVLPSEKEILNMSKQVETKRVTRWGKIRVAEDEQDGKRSGRPGTAWELVSFFCDPITLQSTGQVAGTVGAMLLIQKKPHLFVSAIVATGLGVYALSAILGIAILGSPFGTPTWTVYLLKWLVDTLLKRVPILFLLVQKKPVAKQFSGSVATITIAALILDIAHSANSVSSKHLDDCLIFRVNAFTGAILVMNLLADVYNHCVQKKGKLLVIGDKTVYSRLPATPWIVAFTSFSVVHATGQRIRGAP